MMDLGDGHQFTLSQITAMFSSEFTTADRDFRSLQNSHHLAKFHLTSKLTDI